jgi:hypothetical protein
VGDQRVGWLDRVAGALTAVTDWAIHRTDRRAQLDALLAELEANLGGLDKLHDRTKYEWQRIAASRHLTPELRRIVQRAYRSLDEYQRAVDEWHNPPPRDPGAIYALGLTNAWRRTDAEKAADGARPFVRYAVSCVNAQALRKTLPPPPPEAH